MRSLPVDERGYPVPWFVAWIDGRPEFRCVTPGRVAQAIREGLCWVCGEPIKRDKRKTFVIGPMCAFNRVSAEPPNHRECAEYSATACPFLTRPKMHRRENALPEHSDDPTMITRNPGVVCLWDTLSFQPIASSGRSVVFRIGDPVRVSWYSEGRTATRDEVIDSIRSGLPTLQRIAEEEGAGALMEFRRVIKRTLQTFPIPADWGTFTPELVGFSS
jgi:hypothetical protein